MIIGIILSLSIALALFSAQRFADYFSPSSRARRFASRENARVMRDIEMSNIQHGWRPSLARPLLFLRWLKKHNDALCVTAHRESPLAGKVTETLKSLSAHRKKEGFAKTAESMKALEQEVAEDNRAMAEKRARHG